MPHDPTRFARRAAAALFALAVASAAPLAARADEPKPLPPTADKPAVDEKSMTKKPATRPASAPVKEAADVGAIKLGKDEGKSFLGRHAGFLKDLAAKNGKVGVLFVGDSITDGWRGKGKATFAERYGSLDPLNIGIGGDRTQHVIWRLENGEVEGISPKVAVLMIGTNNLGGNSNGEIAAGITKVVKILNDKLPTTKVLLLGVFPRSEKPTDPARARIKAINEEIAKLDDGGKRVKYLDIGPKFLTEDGTLTKEIMPDGLHPNEKGYQIWADAIQPTLDELMK
ncbi:MAG: lysophospholipase L1-like esterase [Phycisphaerales bacterium]|nr:lysophospholipase L1-like esterase [Phycisphaerales bacterium]